VRILYNTSLLRRKVIQKEKINKEISYSVLVVPLRILDFRVLEIRVIFSPMNVNNTRLNINRTEVKEDGANVGYHFVFGMYFELVV
jgi:hypothetical protein